EQNEGPQQHNLDNYVLVRDREKRTTTIPIRYKDEGNVSLSKPLSKPLGSREEDDITVYAFAITDEEDTHEAITFQEAINSSLKDKWVHDMEEEMSSLKKNHTCELVDQPPGRKLRARIDYNEDFLPVVRLASIRVILSLTACEDYDLEQLDVKIAFLHGNLEETIYIRHPPGFEEAMGNKVYLLKKSLYGLKQSPRQWYKRFDVYMASNGFSRNNYDSCVYFKEFAQGMCIYLLMYVDDILIACKSKSEIEYTKGLLRKKFDMKELGPARKILGMEIVRDRGLVYDKDRGKNVDVDGFVDADYAKDPDKEAEYMVLTEAVKESIWLKGILIELEINLRLVVVNCDNQGAIHLSRNAMFHERTKHINKSIDFGSWLLASTEAKASRFRGRRSGFC
nr:retrotransposon protein, putative, Ty1-copia subclass [Tanacetum cinerariifolium]